MLGTKRIVDALGKGELIVGGFLDLIKTWQINGVDSVKYNKLLLKFNQRLYFMQMFK